MPRFTKERPIEPLGIQLRSLNIRNDAGLVYILKTFGFVQAKTLWLEPRKAGASHSIRSTDSDWYTLRIAQNPILPCEYSLRVSPSFGYQEKLCLDVKKEAALTVGYKLEQDNAGFGPALLISTTQKSGYRLLQTIGDGSQTTVATFEYEVLQYNNNLVTMLAHQTIAEFSTCQKHATTGYDFWNEFINHRQS